jgi:putative phosphoesterase
VRLGLISDVHGNIDALTIALAAMVDDVDEILMAGDAMHEYRFSNEVVEAVRAHGIRSILGNHEAGLLGPGGATARSVPTVRASNLDFVASLSHRLDTKVDGRALAMVHGSPFEPYSDYVVPGSPMLRRCADVGVDVLVLGHTHVPMVERVGSCLVVNPGSLGESRDRAHPRDVSYAILDTASLEVEVRRFPDPRFAAA